MVMRDLPATLDLLELGRRLLLGDILPLVPEARQRDLHLVATSMAILAREAAAGNGPAVEIAGFLQNFYRGGDCAPGPEGGDGGGDVDLTQLLRRLALDLRTGAFETSGSRESAARAILWRLTILKLREGNPQFLAAHHII
jgi:hypothetical protein